jgi:hypothetical protein
MEHSSKIVLHDAESGLPFCFGTIDGKAEH